MNTFISVNNQVVFKATATANIMLERKITTEDEYVLWVREWKAVNKEMVEAIQSLRTMKNEFRDKVRETNDMYQNISTVMSAKQTLRVLARKMYEVRVTNKTSLKSGEYVPSEKKIAA